MMVSCFSSVPSQQQEHTSADTGPQERIELQVNLQQLWPGCRTLLIKVAPRLMFSNETDLDLWIMTTEGSAWKLPKHKVWSADYSKV